MKKLLKTYNIQLKLLLAYAIGVVILGTLYYILVPFILNYPNNTYGNQFQYELENANYLTQVILIGLTTYILFTVTTLIKMRFLVENKDLLDHPLNYSIEQINIVKNKLLSAPYSLFITNICISSIVLTLVHALSIGQLGITTLKLFILVVSLIITYLTAIFIYTNNILKRLLLNLPYDNTTGIKRSSLIKRIMFNILPLFFASIVFMALLGYTRLSKENGDSLFATYNNKLHYFVKYNSFQNIDDLLNKSKEISLLNANDFFFIRDNTGVFYNTNKKEILFSDFFKKYLNELSQNNNGRVYEYYGIDKQASTIDCFVGQQKITIGIYYHIITNNALIFFTISFVFLILINIVVLVLFAKSMISDITTLSNRFLQIAKNADSPVIEYLSLPSNDEIADLTIAFNRIQNMTYKHIEQIKSNQTQLIEQERLASLGQMIGGIAHNLKTPIMSIAGAAEGLNDLADELDNSIGNPIVTNDDYHDIAKDMKKWIEKIKNYSEYMSDVITAVKGQTVKFTNDEEISFTISELLKRVDILMKHELKNAIVYLNISVQTDENTVIKGDVNSLVQIINNMISNSIQAYHGKSEQTIDLIVTKENSKCIISIKDYAGGLPERIKDKLFKEMVTTKGKNGTGLGLYMSYSTIKAHFNGEITFESEPGKGTTFHIILPI